jgi:carboxyl-terminal processing protease
MKKLVVALVLVLITTLSCTTKYRNIHSFETVWQTVNQTHYDPTFGGVDWEAAHERYKPQIAAADSKEEFFMLSNQMLFELNLSHLLVV